LAQIAALVWLRYRLLLARAAPRVVILQVIVFLVMMVAALGAYFVLVLLFRGLPSQMAAEALQVAMALVWGAWTVVPLITGSFDDSTDLSKLLLYPMSPARMTLGVLLSDLVSAPAGFTVLLSVPMGWTRRPADALITGAAAALFAVHMVALAESLRIALWDLLRSRRTRDLLILLAPLAGILAYAVQGIAFRRAPFSNALTLLTLRASRYLRFLPGGLVAGSVANASGGRYGASLGWLALLLVLSAATVAAMALLVRRVQAGEAEAVSRAKYRGAADRRRARAPSAFPIRGAAATVARKELLLFWRDPRLKVYVIQAAVFPAIWVLFMTLWTPVSAPGAPWRAGLFLAAGGFTLFGSFILGANTFGFDGDAASTLFLFPISRRALLTGKNIALWGVLMGFYSPMMVLLAAVTRQWALLPLALLCTGSALLLSLSIGNLLSIYVPYRLPTKRQNPFAMRGGGQGCVGFLLLIVGWLAAAILALPLAAALTLPRALHRPMWYWLALPAAVGYAWWTYRFLLSLAAEHLERREPEIIEAVGPKGSQAGL
jgi:ABC-2 type transport system permease protein